MKILFTLAFSLLFVGCAHNIKIAPDAVSPSADKSKTPVALYISATDKALKTTTPGGGGDKVSYTLAKDLEYSVFSLLNGNYNTVKVLESSHDVATMKSDGLSLVFEPTFGSTSSGSSLFIWPADKFSITINCKVYDQSGKLVVDKQLTGEGTATSNELMGNFAIAANRAANQVLAQLKQEIETNPALK